MIYKPRENVLNRVGVCLAWVWYRCDIDLVRYEETSQRDEEYTYYCNCNCHSRGVETNTELTNKIAGVGGITLGLAEEIRSTRFCKCPKIGLKI